VVSSLGLDVQTSTKRQSEISWRLLLEYEDLLGLDDPPELPPEIGEEPELVTRDFPVAVLETTKSCRMRQGNLRVTRIRDFQAMPAIELNPEVHIHLAYKDVNAALDPTQWPAIMPPPGLDHFIELVRPQVAAEVQRLAEAQLIKRAPEKGLMIKLEDARWVTQPSRESASSGS
jgi:hypothetical protein